MVFYCYQICLSRLQNHKCARATLRLLPKEQPLSFIQITLSTLLPHLSPLVTVEVRHNMGEELPVSWCYEMKQSDHMPLIRDFKAKIETELTDICDDILRIIESKLIPKCTAKEGEIFYYKMKGDYHR